MFFFLPESTISILYNKHILIQIKPTEDDKSNTEKKLRDIYQQSEKDSGYFDSLAYQYQIDYQNQSGVFGLTPDNAIPPKILNILESYKGTSELLYPEESENDSYYLVFVKNRVGEDKTTLENSWQALEIMAKNNKIAEEFEMWINSEKEHIFIQKF